MATAFALRPLERSSASTLKEGFRIHLADKELRSQQLAGGDLVRISSANGHHGFAVAWPGDRQTNTGNKPIAKISPWLQERYGLKLSERYFIEKAIDAWKPIEHVSVSTAQAAEALSKYSSREELTYWISSSLARLTIILPGETFDVQQEGAKSHRNSKLRATVGKIEPAGDNNHALYFNPLTSKVVLEGESAANGTSIHPEGTPVNTEISLQIDSGGVGGLSEQVDEINARLDYLTYEDAACLDPHLSCPETFLIHGPDGCGKSLLLDRLARCPWRQVHKLDDRWLNANRKGLSEALSTDVFANAREQQPSIVLIDNLDNFLKKGEDLVSCLRQEIEKLQGTQVVVAGAVRSIYDIDASLRTPWIFQTELELSPPNVRQREETLRKIIGPTQEITDVDFVSLAERSHGFVGRDIKTLCYLARKHRKDQITRDSKVEKLLASREHSAQLNFVTQADFDAVIDRVHPSVLKDSVLEVPKMRWTDIAGVDHVRTLLEDITVRPYKYPDLDIKFGGVQSRKGVLLYGPPGCAKTLIAQAVATESNLNFLAVKGSELIKMYVGESERAIRDVFRRARAAKPCIIFFDEIDSIGKSREKTQDSGLNVVATLLNEMDGIEALKDVFIIGATNRPDILDSALIRTGRFDAHIHIGLPNQDARRQIVEIHTRKRPLASDVDLAIIASRTEGSSGADIKGLCDIAIEMAKSDYVAVPDSDPMVKMSHFERALAQHVPHTIKEEAEKYEGWRPGKSLSANA
ncbi:AAA-domain-containing protein [Byssothecium circinans]|uniref:AAA-domain-containing protein n=1 Tax=Byssothecium circinans TaxID=147558 RepID=A0A6A5TRZ7_9PLEO|nr:AAA-domain-containing protein [Byssothecium circinans]